MSHPRVSQPRARRARPAAVESLETRTLFAATVIDVMVVYDLNAKAYFNNSDADIQRAIRQSIDVANLAHQNTGDNVVLRLVRTAPISYNSSGSQSTDLANLAANPTVANDRTAFGADLVQMVVTSGSGGLANLLTNTGGSQGQAFSVVSASSLTPGALVSAHEFAHNLGAGHERDNVSDPSTGAFPAYSFGYHVTGAHGTNYGDAMSYQGAQIPVFATPTYTRDGVAIGKPIGDPNAADLRSTFLVTAPNVATYRATVVADAAPTASLWQTDQVGDQLTFTVRYVDDVSVSAASLDSSDAYVQTPEGFKLAAEFLGADVAGDGYARVARYRVTLPANLPALSSLGFFVNAGQVKDTANAAVAGGQLAANFDGDLDSAFVASSPNASLTGLVTARDTGALAANGTRTLTNALRQTFDGFDEYKFTVAAQTGLSVAISNLAANALVLLYKDANLNELVNPGEQVGFSNATAAAGGSVSYAAAPGTYYVYVQANGAANSNYTLSITGANGNAGDAVAPTATLDVADKPAPTNTVDFSVIYRDDKGLDASTVANAAVDATLSVTFSGTNTASPVSTTVVDSRTVVANYSLNFGGTVFPANTVLTMKVAAGSALKDANGNNIVTGTTLGSYTIAPAAADVSAPTASVFSAPPILVPNGAATANYDFVIAYKDNRGVATATLGTGDVRVTGPASSGLSNAPAAFVSSALSAGGGFRYATYRVTAPGGAWDWTDDGTYTLSLAAGEVKDAANNSAAAGAIGSFTVHVPYPGDATGDDVVDFNDLVPLAQNYNVIGGKGVADGDFNYDGSVDFNDLVFLAQNYNTTKPPNPAAPLPLSAPGEYAAVIAAVDPAKAKKSIAAKPTPVFSVVPVKAPVVAAKPPVRKAAARR